MPIYRRYLSYIKFPLPGADFMTAFTVLAILVQFWLGSMVDESGFVTAELEHNYLVLGLSWSGISQWHLWQIVTYALAHGGWFHLVANLLMLWVVGGRVIDILGQKKFVLIVMVGVFAGGLLHLVIDYVVMGRGYPGTQLVGISGGCLALLLTLTTLSPASRVWPFRVSRKNLGFGILLAMLLLLLMTPALNVPVFSHMGKIISENGGSGLFVISHACHFGGAMAGWLLTSRLLVLRPSLLELQRARSRWEKKM